MKKTKYKKISLLIFFVLITSITIGYSILEQNVEIKGTATLKNEENDNNVTKYIVTYSIDSKWNTNGLYYYNISINILNNTSEILDGWKIVIDAPQDVTLQGYYNVNALIQNNKIYFENVSYNSQISPGNNTTFSFILSTTEEDYKPGNITINGSETNKPENPEEGERKAEITIKSDGKWQSGDEYYYQNTVTVKNTGTLKINSWQFDINIDEKTTIEQIWNAVFNKVDTKITLKNSNYNGVIDINNSVNFGMIIKTSEENKEFTPIDIVLK